jgi:hypothetical protein
MRPSCNFVSFVVQKLGHHHIWGSGCLSPCLLSALLLEFDDKYITAAVGAHRARQGS